VRTIDERGYRISRPPQRSTAGPMRPHPAPGQSACQARPRRDSSGTTARRRRVTLLVNGRTRRKASASKRSRRISRDFRRRVRPPARHRQNQPAPDRLARCRETIRPERHGLFARHHSLLRPRRRAALCDGRHHCPDSCSGDPSGACRGPVDRPGRSSGRARCAPARQWGDRGRRRCARLPARRSTPSRPITRATTG
jgi:hypothetical protein